MNVDAYLQRIGYDGNLAPTPDTLRRLQRSHLLSVPFENLSIHWHEPIVLNDEALFQKIIDRRRGGFCYELNGLLAALLTSLGFKVTKLSAQVANSEGVFGPDFDHMTLLVDCEQRWLVDVGFGDSFPEPLLLDERRDQIQDGRAYRITEEDDRLMMWQRLPGEDWKPQYRFTLMNYEYPDYDEMCRFHQTSPSSHFTKNTICSRATPDGRLTLSGMRYIITTPSGREERLLSNDAEFAALLESQFGITT
jgi:N-hydroxyarylamine O-acetyltransferase